MLQHCDARLVQPEDMETPNNRNHGRWVLTVTFPKKLLGVANGCAEDKVVSYPTRENGHPNIGFAHVPTTPLLFHSGI